MALAKYEDDDTRALVKDQIDLELAEMRTMTPEDAARAAVRAVAEAEIAIAEAEAAIREGEALEAEAEAAEAEAKAAEAYFLEMKYRIAPPSGLLDGRTHLNLALESSKMTLAKYEDDDARALMKARVDLELAKMRTMTPEEVARAAVQAVVKTEEVVSEVKAVEAFILNPPIRAHLGVKREMNFMTTAEPMKESCKMALAKYENDDTRALVKAEDDLELAKMRTMTPEELARAAAQAVAGAEIAVAEAEAAVREGEAMEAFILGVKRKTDFVTTAEPTKKKK